MFRANVLRKVQHMHFFDLETPLLIISDSTDESSLYSFHRHFVLFSSGETKEARISLHVQFAPFFFFSSLITRSYRPLF